MDKRQGYTNRELKQYIKRSNTLFARQKRLFKAKQKLINLEEPVLFLTRTSGDIEMYMGVKGKEFKVPGLPEGTEKRIQLGPHWQEKIPYAGQTFRAYRCHEDYAFPHLWGHPNVYKGKNVSNIRTWINNNPNVDRIPILLESANVNAEAFRDRERKVLIAWENFNAKASSMNIQAWAKFALFIGAGIALVLFVYFMWGPKPEVIDAASVAKQAAETAIQGIQVS